MLQRHSTSNTEAHHFDMRYKNKSSDNEYKERERKLHRNALQEQFQQKVCVFGLAICGS